MRDFRICEKLEYGMNLIIEFFKNTTFSGYKKKTEFRNDYELQKAIIALA